MRGGDGPIGTIKPSKRERNAIPISTKRTRNKRVSLFSFSVIFVFLICTRSRIILIEF